MIEVYEYQGIEIGTWADTVLKLFPSSDMISSPLVLGRDADGLVVEWQYKDVTFTIARAELDHIVYGNMTVYAVQKIEVSDV